ncbi:MAG: diacylglycerol kinase family protein [Chryseolinea sp.]
MKNQKFSTSQRLKSFGHAFNGLKILLKEEHNARIHLVAAIMVVIAGVVLKVSTIEWIAVVFAAGFVITTEIINSSIENIADFISPEKHEKIKKIKDLAAAGVLVSAVTAVIIGVIVFLPRIITLF